MARRSVIACAVISVVLAACGGGGESGDPAPAVQARPLNPEPVLQPPAPEQLIEPSSIVGSGTFTNGQPAAVVIGQYDFVTATQSQGANANGVGIGRPGGTPAWSADGKLFIPDFSNNRIMAFNALPTTNGKTADFVIGPDSLTSDAGPNALQNVIAVSAYAGKLAAAVFKNSTIQLFNSVPAGFGAVADLVWGGFGCSATSLNGPQAIELIPGGKLVVSDTNNNRVLIWNAVPATASQPPDIVLGQATFDKCANNDDLQDGTGNPDAPTARTLNHPVGIWSDGTRLAIADAINHRVLIWSTMPTSSFAPADIVLGQNAFTRRGQNDDDQDGVSNSTSPTARTFSGPASVGWNGRYFAVSDNMNGRVLLWDGFPAASFRPADVVLGKSDFVTRLAVPPTQQSMRSPRGIRFRGDTLIVSDGAELRVMVFQAQTP